MRGKRNFLIISVSIITLFSFLIGGSTAKTIGGTLAVSQAEPNMDFSWQVLAGISCAAFLEVDDDSDFSSVIVSQPESWGFGGGVITDNIPVASLPSGATLYWRIRETACHTLALVVGPGTFNGPNFVVNVCGDNIVTGTEVCDDGNTIDCDGCKGDCTRADGICGDGIPECGEGCDDGNSINTDACPDGSGGTCQPAVCGDGFIQSGVEECDDGGTVDGDGCSSTCTIESTPGSGTCPSEDQRIMKLFAPSNAHGALWDDALFTYEICYDAIFGAAYIGASPHTCVGGNLNKAAGLYDIGNAHAEEPGLSNFGTNACYGDLACTMRDINCDANENMTIALFQDTNSHITDPNYIPANMISWWRLDEEAGAGVTTAPDYAGSNDGTLTDMDPATDWVLGKSGNALDFDGSNDIIVVPDSPGLRLGAQQTVEAWISVDSYTGTWTRFVGKGDASTTSRNYGLWLQSDGDLLLQIWDTVSSTYCNFYDNLGPGSDSNIPAGSGWHHVAGTYDGTDGKLYIDGAEVHSSSCSATPPSTADPVIIGGSENAVYFDGMIDEIAIYNRALTPEEIQHRYNMGQYEKKICCRTASLPPAVTIDYDGNLGPVFGPHTFGPSDFIYTYPVIYTATATDNSGTGISAVRIYVDGVLEATCATSPCQWTEANGYATSQTVSFYAEADDNDGTSGMGSSAVGSFTVCSLDSASIDDSACTGPGGGCVQGDTITITAAFSGDTCPSGTEPLFAQIDADSGDGCHIEAAVGAGDIVGIGASIDKATYQGTWTVPAVPIDCRGKTVLPTSASLREDLDITEPWLFFGFGAGPTGSATFADISISLSIVPDPLYVREGDPVNIFSTADGGGVNIQLQCGESSDAEGDGYANNGGQICTTNNFAPNNPTCSFTSPWADSNAKTIYCRVYDSASYSAQVSIQVYSDNTAPVVTWNAPSDPSYFRDGAAIPISADISDPNLDDGNPGAGITDGMPCTPMIDGLAAGFSETAAVTYSSITATTGTCTGIIQLGNPSNIADGNHLLTLDIADVLGNGEIVGDWDLDEGIGDTAGDSSTHSNDGTLMNGLDSDGWRFGASCVSGSCLDFDGTDDYILINTDDFRTPESTWSAWIQRGPLTTRYFLGYATSTADRFLVNADNGNLIFHDDIENEGQSVTVAANVFQAGEWHYVTILFDSAGIKSAYVDGVLAGQDSDGSNLSLINSGASFYIGAQINGNNPFDGLIDEVKVYAHAVVPRSIFIDNTVPVCTPKQPGNDVGGTYWSTGSFDLTWAATDLSGSDPGSGIDHYNVSYGRNMPAGNWYDAFSSGYEIAAAQPSCISSGASSWDCSLTVGDPAELSNHRDYYDFRCNATDRAGNTGPTSAAVRTRIDSVDPVSVLVSPTSTWVNSTDPSSIILKVDWTSTDGSASVADSSVNCSYFKIQRCNHKAGPGATDCSDWGEWYYGEDHLAGTLSECIAPSSCTGGECAETFLFDGDGFTPAGVPVIHPIEALEIYNFTLWANDMAGNIELHDVADPIIDPIKPKYKINVTVQNSAGGTEVIEGNGAYSLGEITAVRLGSYAWDNESGLNLTILEYAALDDTGSSSGSITAENGTEFCYWDGDTSSIPNCVNETSTGWIAHDEDTVYIRYRVYARDDAGNINSSTTETSWYYITAYSLANFMTHQLYLTFGVPYDLGLQVRNLQTEYDTITIDLSGYTSACFLNTTQGRKIDCDTMEVGLNPYEEKIIFVRIIPNKVSETPYTLIMDAVSSINAAVNTDSVSINVGYPASFPGLSEWAIMALIILSVLFYTKIGPRMFRSGGKGGSV